VIKKKINSTIKPRKGERSMQKEDILEPNSFHKSTMNVSSSRLLSSSRYLEEKSIPSSDFVLKSPADDLLRST